MRDCSPAVLLKYTSSSPSCAASMVTAAHDRRLGDLEVLSDRSMPLPLRVRPGLGASVLIAPSIRFSSGGAPACRRQLGKLSVILRGSAARGRPSPGQVHHVLGHHTEPTACRAS